MFLKYNASKKDLWLGREDRNGFGIQLFDQSFIYAGSWLEGKPNGTCCFCCDNEFMFVGKFEQGKCLGLNIYINQYLLLISKLNENKFQSLKFTVVELKSKFYIFYDNNQRFTHLKIFMCQKEVVSYDFTSQMLYKLEHF